MARCWCSRDTTRAVASVRASAWVFTTDDDITALLEGVVDSQERGRGLGRRLIETILEGHDGPVDAWSHGDHPAARHLAQTLGFEPVREPLVSGRIYGCSENLPFYMDPESSFYAAR